jgi:hypothetical protein
MNFKSYLESVHSNKRIHLSKKPIENFYDVKQYRSCYKPEGIWYACNNSWESAENRNPFDSAAYKYLLEIDFSRVIKLSSVQEILDFNKEFGELEIKMFHPRSGRIVPYEEQEFERKFEKLKQGEKDFHFMWLTAQERLQRGKKEDDVRRDLLVHVHCMNWDKVSNVYGGVEVCPYFDENSLHRKVHGSLNWYGHWDIASGCLWEASCITSFKLLKTGAF